MFKKSTLIVLALSVFSATSWAMTEFPPGEKPERDFPVKTQFDSTWRHMASLGLGTLAPHAADSQNTLNQDYKDGSGVGLGYLVNYRPDENWALEFGSRIMLFSRDAKNTALSLRLFYLAFPLEVRHKLFNIGKRSSFYAKGGLTFMLLMTATIDDTESSSSSGGGWYDDDDWDLYASPPTKGDRESSFNSTDILASVGAGFDILLFQTSGGFNMSLLPELMYYRSIKPISKSGEFTSDVYNKGFLLNLSLAFGF